MCNCRDLNRRQALLAGVVIFGTAASGRYAQAQETIRLNGPVCKFESAQFLDGELLAFAPSDEARQLVAEICNVVGLPANFGIKAVNDPRINAAARVDGSQRLIIFDNGFMKSIAHSTTRNWSGLTVLAHEIGHHLCGHTLENIGSRPPRELEADFFAGLAVARLGGTLQQASQVFESLDPRGSETHPPRADRLKAVLGGWTRGRAAPEERHYVMSHFQRDGRPPTTRSVRPAGGWEHDMTEFIGFNRLWTERSRHATFNFIETHRHDSSVFLFDASRNIWVRLDASQTGFATGYWAMGDGSTNQVPTDWTPLDPREWRGDPPTVRSRIVR